MTLALRLDLTQAPGPGAREVVDAPTPWRRPAALFYLDLSGRQRPTTALHPDRDMHGVAQAELGPRLVYGSHHFHAFLDERDGWLSLPETDRDRVEFRLDHHIAHPPDGGVPVLRRVGARFEAGIPPGLAEAAEVLDGEVFHASPSEPGNWGMWLLEGLPNLHAFVRRGQVGRLLCWAETGWQRALMAFMGVDPARLVAQAPWGMYRVGALAVRQVTRVNLAPSASERALFAEIVARAGQAAGPERIFVGRRHLAQNAGRRRLDGEEALAGALAGMGFADVRPEALPFEEQVRLFAGARVVVGLGGAAMFNTVFCRPGTLVVSIEGGPYFTDDHASLFAGLGHRYGFILGDRHEDDPHGAWTLDVARAVEAIRAFG